MSRQDSVKKLKKLGYRVTSSRKKILSIFQQARKPLTLKEAELQLKKIDSRINQSTLYRTVDLFVKQHILIHGECTDHHTYQLLQASKTHSLDLICIVCGSTKNIPIRKKVFSQKTSPFRLLH